MKNIWQAPMVGVSMSNPKEFGSYLKQLREAKGYTISQLALYSGVSHSYISRIEAGKRGAPSPEVLQKMADVLSVSFEELMIAAGHWPEPNEAKTIAASSSEKEGPLTREEFESLVKAFKKLGIDIDI
jgi:transcriptional regulator with XRE-family HTH domain